MIKIQDFRNSRAVCPHCSDGEHRRFRKWTVAINGELFFCHRCHEGGNVRSLARQQGISLPQRRIRKADIPKQQFRAWLSQKMSEMSHEECERNRQWRFADQALQFPELAAMEEVWQALATYYHRERFFQQFWQSATDKIGRYWLYRAWRKHAT